MSDLSLCEISCVGEFVEFTSYYVASGFRYFNWSFGRLYTCSLQRCSIKTGQNLQINKLKILCKINLEKTITQVFTRHNTRPLYPPLIHHEWESIKALPTLGLIVTIWSTGYIVNKPCCNIYLLIKPWFYEAVLVNVGWYWLCHSFQSIWTMASLGGNVNQINEPLELGCKLN